MIFDFFKNPCFNRVSCVIEKYDTIFYLEISMSKLPNHVFRVSNLIGEIKKNIHKTILTAWFYGYFAQMKLLNYFILFLKSLGDTPSYFLKKRFKLCTL